MTTQETLKNLKIYTTFDKDMNMTDARMESETRTLYISLGRVSKKWSIHLEDKTRQTISGMNVTLKTYFNKDFNFVVKYWDKKLIEYTK